MMGTQSVCSSAFYQRPGQGFAVPQDGEGELCGGVARATIEREIEQDCPSLDSLALSKNHPSSSMDQNNMPGIAIKKKIRSA